MMKKTGMRVKMRRFLKMLTAISTAAACTLLSGTAALAEEELEMSKPGEVCSYENGNVYRSFFVPTQVYSVNGEFFVADAYNNQIVWSDSASHPAYEWKEMANNLYRPHAIASDGVLYVAVDTDNNRVVTYSKTDVGFRVEECFENVGVRPHYIEYDAATKQFYVWSSMTGTMYIYKRKADSLQLTLKKTAYIKDLDGCYTRSFTIDGGNIYFPSMGRNAIYVVNKKNFGVKAVYGVSEKLGGMVQVRHEQNYYYLVTSSDAAGDQSNATIVRSSSLSGFVEGSYEDIRDQFPDMNGDLYYISYLEDGHYYVPVITNDGSNPYICRFDIVDDAITNVENYYT